MITFLAVRRLAQAMLKLREQLPRAELLPREVLDILWLAQLMGPSASVAARPPAPAAPARKISESHEQLPEKPPAPGRPPISSRPRLPVHRHPGAQTAEADMHVATFRDQHTASVAARALRAPGAAALRDTLPIARGLRPLRRRVGVRSAFVFDETATAERFAESRLFHPVFRPTPAGWLDLALVAHASGSMDFWWQTIDELRIVLERHSAFRHVRSWRLVDEENGELSLRAWSAQSQPVQQKELLTAGGRLLIAVVSDCVSPAWSDQRMANLLQGWMANGPLAVFQVLPSELWPRTEMRHARFTKVRATEPGALNARLITSESSKRGDAITIPVTTLDRGTLTTWARVIAGTGGAVGRAMVLPLTVDDSVRRARTEQIAAIWSASAEERVSRFNLTASEDAREMARLLAAAHFPLTPPIMRLIQHTVLPGAPPSAIAEVLLSGLLERASSAPGDDPQMVRYAFTDEAVRQRLLDSATAAHVLQVLRMKVSQFIGARFGTVLDFAALLADPTSIGNLSILPEEEPFARIGVSALRRLGGEYREIADRIERRIEGANEADAALATRVALTGRRLALDERLRSASGMESADGFVRSLYEWGLPVVVLAAIAAADRVTRTSDEDPRALLRHAREALSLQTSEAAAKIRDRIGTDASADMTAAAHAARAAAVAFYRNEPPRNGTMAAAERCVRAAVAWLDGDDAAVVAAMANALRRDVMSETSVVSEALPVRAWILVAGSGDYELPPVVNVTAAELGAELASHGFRLLSGGWGGVDYVTSLAFAVEVELRGGEVDGRLRHLHEGERPGFDYGSRTRVRGDWIEQALTGFGTDPKAQAVVTLGGGRSVAELIRRADQYHVPAAPLPWTGGASLEAAKTGRVYRFGRYGMFEDTDIATAEDANVLMRRLVRMLGVATDRALLDQWIDYTNTVLTIVRSATEPPLDQRAPRLNRWLKALVDGQATPLDASPQQLEATLARVASFFPHWLVDDFEDMTEFEREGFGSESMVIERFAEAARAHAYELALERLEERFHALASPVPSRPIDLLPAAGRAFFGGYDELDRWTKTTIGVDASECFFRASIPFDTYCTARRYIEHEPTLEGEKLSDAVRKELIKLAPRREYVRRFIDEKNEAARVIGYIFMHLFDLGIGPTELASRIEVESRRAVRDSRPFRQLTIATENVVRRFEPAASRIVARALVAAAGVISKQQHTLDGLVTRLLRGKLASADAENRIIDEEAQRFARPRRLKTTVDKLPSALRAMSFSAAEVEYLFDHGNRAQRLLALRLAPETIGRTPFESIRHALLRPADETEALLAVIAADRLAERLTYSQLVILIESIGNAYRRFADQRHVLKYLSEALDRLLRRRDHADRVRLAPIAVLGSDPSGAAFRDFVRDFGERLAMNELGIITANATFGVWLWEGYRRRRPDLESFVVLRRASDQRPLSEGLPTRVVQGDLSDLRAELIGRARGAILIGGGYAAYREYEIAKRRDIPIVAIGAAGGAAADVADATLTRLELLGISTEPLRDNELSIRMAAAAANVLTRAVLAAESKTDTSVTERRRAATLDSDELLMKVARIDNAPRRTLEAARVLLDAVGGGTIRWTRTADDLRRLDRYVQALRPEFPANMDVAELTARCAYAYALVELSMVDELRDSVRVMAAYDRLSAAPPDVVRTLMHQIDTTALRTQGALDAAARLRAQIAERMTAL